MTKGSFRIVLWIAAFLAGATASMGVILLANERPRTVAIGGPFQLIDQDGRTVTEQALLGRPSLVFFGYTHCPDVCPATMYDISQIMQALGPDADRARAVFITVDPERDTQPVLKDYMSSFDPHITGLTGDLDAITAVAKEYRVYFRKVATEGDDYGMDHTAITYLMDKDGRFVAPFSLKRTTEEAAADLRRHL
jgi:protein SCO1/2